jgi:phenylacetate-CoA ligase
VNAGDRELYLWGSPIERTRTDALRSLRDRLFNQRLLDAFNMSGQRIDGYLDALEAFRPTSLFGYPSSIALLVAHAQRRGRTVNRTALRAVFVTGEVCWPHHRAAVGEYFGVPVADGYGSRDAGFIAHQCERGSMHITAENVIVEIVNGDRVCPVGEPGEIVITHLDCYAMPMIRYRTGDHGRLLPGRCACGRGLPLMDVVSGRCTDFLRLPDGNVRHALSIIYPLRETPGIRQFSVVQAEDYGVVVNVVRDDTADRITHEAVSRRLRPVIGDQVRLDVRLVDYIEPSPSGKHRYVTSNVRPGSAEVGADDR